MPEKKTLESSAKAKREGKAPSTQAGPFVKEEMDHVKEGKHGVASKKQAIAIGLSKARRAGVNIKPPSAGKSSSATRKKAKRDIAKGHSGRSAQASGAVVRGSDKSGKRASHRSTSSKKTAASSRKRATASKRTSRKRASR